MSSVLAAEYSADQAGPESELQMPEMEAPKQTKAKTAGVYLEVMSKAAFQGGMSWEVVEVKWLRTREWFRNFDSVQVAKMTPSDIDRLAKNERVIRNRRNLEAVVTNAQRLLETKHGSVKKYLPSHGDFESTVPATKKDFKFGEGNGERAMLHAIRGEGEGASA